MDFSVAIPTYNGATRLPEVLDALKQQTHTESLIWEILVVDNNSCDHTAQIVQHYQESWPERCPLKYCFEPQQGLRFARQCAIDNSASQYVGFLDDDNIPFQNWVFAAYHFGEMYSQAGAYGGKIHAKLDELNPELFEQVGNYLAIRQYGEVPQQFQPERLQLPAGAGLVVRREAWLACVPSPSQAMYQGRGADDYEISLHLYKSGWQIWYNPAMEIWHHIPPQRLERKYLVSITYLYGLLTCEMLMILAKPWQQPWILARSFLGSSKRLIFHFLRLRFQANQEINHACELAFHWGNLLSPLRYIKLKLIQIFR